MSSANHIWHVWMNRLNEGKKADEWDHSIYLWKDALAFTEYGHDRIKQAFDGTLPQTHQQCPLSAPERIEQNTLRCCLGQEVTTCPILLQIKGIHEEHWNRPIVECSGYDPGKYYREKVSPEDMYRTMAKTCAWHVYEESKKHFVDASEGFHLDESDRRFWRRAYDSMAGCDPESPVTDGEAG